MAAAALVVDVDALVEETSRQIRGIAQQPITLPTGAIGAGEKVTFCSLWPTVKAVLQAVRKALDGWLRSSWEY
jgi:hypothetical protein